MNDLNVKQEKFCVLYFQTGNATQSYIDAGYSEKTAMVCASQLLDNPKIIQRIKQLQEGFELGSVATVHRRKQKLSEIIEKGELDPSSITPRDRISAVSELNKMEKLYSDTPQVVHNTQIVFVIGKGYTDKTDTDSPTLLDQSK